MVIIGVLYQIDNLAEAQGSYMPPNPSLGKEYYVTKDTMKIYEKFNGELYETKDFDFLKVPLTPPTTPAVEEKSDIAVVQKVGDRDNKVVAKVDFLMSLVNPAMIPQELK